jgi:hypothetical protein
LFQSFALLQVPRLPPQQRNYLPFSDLNGPNPEGSHGLWKRLSLMDPRDPAADHPAAGAVLALIGPMQA